VKLTVDSLVDGLIEFFFIVLGVAISIGAFFIFKAAVHSIFTAG